MAATVAGALAGARTAAVGFSGGLDSTLLLALAAPLAKAGTDVLALHVNHGLQRQADAWEEHCREHAAQLGVRFAAVRAQVRPGSGFEDRARRARLRAFSACRADAVAVAHHASDQAETALLRILRGSGVRGLAAMRARRALDGNGGVLLRPLLAYTREQIRAEARRRRLQWIEDPSNACAEPNRNWLRLAVLPEAEKRFPGAGRALAASAANAAEAAKLLDALAAADDEAARDARGRLRRAHFRQLGSARIRNWLQWSIAGGGLAAPSAGQLAEAASQIAGTGGLRQSFGPLALVAAGSALRWESPQGGKARIGSLHATETSADA